jgi:hypothetical protein
MPSNAALPQHKHEENMTKLLFVSAIALAAIGGAAQAEIMCSQHGGCWETGGRILRDGGVNRQQSVINRREGKDYGKTDRIKCNTNECSAARRR